jgi:hypothetical protein
MQRRWLGLARRVAVAGAIGVGCSGASGKTPIAGESSDNGAPLADGGTSASGEGGASACALTSAGGADAATPSCAYTDDESFCKCLGHYDCGAVTIKDASGANRSVYCGACSGGQWCTPGALGVGVGTCGCASPIAHQWQRDKINMLVSMGENDNTSLNYPSCSDIHDGRGFTIGQVGFCSGTGDFILAAACYNDRKPNNVLSKYWNALVAINDKYIATGVNQGDTTFLTALGDFCGDVAAAAAEPDGIFDRCQDAVGDALYMDSALMHFARHGFQGLLTLGFLYDTELNFGEEDDGKPVLGGTRTIVAKADADYAALAPLPADFTGKAWEESRWLGFLIQERVVEMSGNRTWKKDLDQNATWEGARRLHTGASNSPESDTDLGMAYDITSAFKAGSPSAGGPCWAMPPLASNADTQSTVYVVGLDKSGSATDPSLWKATGEAAPTDAQGNMPYAACPANPTAH